MFGQRHTARTVERSNDDDDDDDDDDDASAIIVPVLGCFGASRMM